MELLVSIMRQNLLDLRYAFLSFHYRELGGERGGDVDDVDGADGVLEFLDGDRHAD